MRPRSVRSVLPALAAALLLASCTAPPFPEGRGGGRERGIGGEGRVERQVMLMGTSLEIEVEAADRATALQASERAVQALEEAEARLSTWREDTELARLNRAPAGERVALSPDLAADLGGARRCWEQTGGAFNPAVGPLVRAWGLREGGRMPSPAELREALLASDLSGLRMEAASAVRESVGLLLEEGGFGKGAGLGDALAALEETPGVSRAALDLGGQVAVFARSAGEPWTVPVADPRRRDRPAVALSVDRGSVSTSGNSERGIEVDGRKLGHILDPRTGEPAPDFGSLTVWTADPLFADCLSTGLYVMGPKAALGWAAAHPGVEVLALLPRGGALEALATPGLQGKLKVLDGEVRLRFWRPEEM